MLLVISLLVLLVTSGFAQYRASLQGTITDEQGAVIPGATVTITSTETNNTRTATTTNDGFYSVPALAPGLYKVTVEKTGFKKKVLEGIRVTADQVQGLSAQLAVGDVAETVTVTDATPAINVENASITGTVTSQQIQKLPAFGRDVYQLAQLAPGVFGDAAQNGGGGTAAQPGNQGPGGSGATDGIFAVENRPQVSSGGGRTDSNAVNLDGVAISSVSWGGAAVVTPNPDSVKEVKVVSNGYDAEYGRFSGAQIQVISQNGTNQYHGSYFFKVDRPGLNAYQKFSGSAGQPHTPQRNDHQFNQWGGSVGGPIIKNKLFAFFAYETIRNNSTVHSQGWYETPQLLQLAPANSLAARYAAYPGASPDPSSITDQTCAGIGLVEGTNCHMIPGQGLDVGRPLDQALFPLGTPDPSAIDQFHPGLGGDGTGNSANLDGIPDIMLANIAGPDNSKEQQFNGRLDFQATSKDLIAFNIYKVPVDHNFLNGARPANFFHHSQMNEAETLLWTRTFSPTFINELRVNAAGWRWNELDSNPQMPLGLPQPNIGLGGNAHMIGSANPGDQQLGGPAGSIFNQWTYSFKDTATKVKGSHNIRFGVEITKLHFVQDAPWSARPNFNFHNYWDFLNDAPYQESGVFNPLTGVPTDVRKDSRSTLYGFFVQDDYKLRPNLTVNLGLRYDYFGPISFLHDALSTVVLGQGANVLTGMSMKIGGNLYNADKFNLGPQIGFAWSPKGFGSYDFNNKFVVHGGFGIGYNNEQQAITLNGWGNIPFTNNGTSLTGSEIVYDFPSDPNQFSPYPANPNTILTFGPNNIPITGSPVGVTAFPKNFPTAYTYRYSLDGQYEIGRNWVATVGYQGSSSRHLTRQYNLNVFYAAQGIALNPMINNVDYYSKDGNAHFNALLTNLNHRFSNSFQMDVQYRLARSSDNESGPYSVSYYMWAPQADWGPSDFDVTHAFKLYGIWSPTIFKGSNSWLEKILGGWSISGILNAHTGYPWTPATFGSCDFGYVGSSCGPAGAQASLMPVTYLGGGGSSTTNSTFLGKGGNFPSGPAAYFVPAAVAPCVYHPTPTTTAPAVFPNICPGVPQFPGIARNSFRGPRYRDIDATLSKSFGLPNMPVLGENAKIEFRANAFNLFNNVNLKGISTDINPNNAAFGQATDAYSGRTIELQARFNF
ncbi:MAG: TonB-dependent receptor domain-containing protein [Acidobacteriaceae bacterium]